MTKVLMGGGNESSKKYRQVWFFGFSPRLQTMNIDQIENLSEKQKESILAEWKNQVWTENTQRSEHQLLNIRKLPEEVELLVPHWIMDRLKEALDQYVQGQWLSSIVLCGAIVEFLSMDLFKAYPQKVPKGEHPPSKRVIKNLKKLRDWKILEMQDYNRLYEVRKFRNDHVHLKRLGQDAKLLKLNNLKALMNLLEFFNKDNMYLKYEKYLRYLIQYSLKTSSNND